MINWKVRIRNKNFWLAVVPALLLAVQGCACAVWCGLGTRCTVGQAD